MSPALNGSSTLERFERSNASEIRNGIMFDFYQGLPHTLYLVATGWYMHQITYLLISQYKRPALPIAPLVRTHSWQTPPHRTSAQVSDGEGPL